MGRLGGRDAVAGGAPRARQGSWPRRGRDAGCTVKLGRPHHGYKAHGAVDETHTLIRKVARTAAHVPDSREVENVVQGDAEMARADKASWSKARSEWCGRKGLANGILRRAGRGQTPRPAILRVNRLLSPIRRRIERASGWWKRSAHCRRVRYEGREAHRRGPECKSICWNLKRLAALGAA